MVLASASLIGAPNSVIILLISESHPAALRNGVHLHIVEAVTRRAIAFDHIEAWCLLEVDWLLVGEHRRRQHGGQQSKNNFAHGLLHQAAVSVRVCMTLLW
jgi:hypothetical protein